MAPKPPKTTELKESIGDESKEVQRGYKLLMEADGLKDAFNLAVATYGKSSQSIASSLFSQNQAWGQKDTNGNPKPYDSAVISRMRKALSYIDSP